MKKKTLKKSIYIISFFLLICYTLSLSLYLVIFFRDFNNISPDKNNNNNDNNKFIYIGKTYIITNIIVISFIIILTTLFVCYFNCFLSQGILVFHIITLFIMLIFLLPSFFILLENILYNKGECLIIILFSFIFNILEVICGFISLIVCLSLRNVLIKEIMQSPLNFVDLDMNEKIYNNILHKSQIRRRKITKTSIDD